MHQPGVLMPETSGGWQHAVIQLRFLWFIRSGFTKLPKGAMHHEARQRFGTNEARW